MSVITKQEARDLARILKKIPRQGFWIPQESFRALHGAVSMWAPELVITRREHREILLTIYRGPYFNNVWHIPGGYNVWNESFRQTCDRLAKLELGVRITPRFIIEAYKWRRGEHPYGRPLSLFTLCVPRGKITETNEAKFFPVNRLPSRIVPCQRRFIQRHFKTSQMRMHLRSRAGLLA